MIYFAQTPSGSIKIGHSATVDTRLRNLASHYGSALRLLATMPGGREEERNIHARFSHHRIGRTEQFRPGRDLLEFIGNPMIINDGARPVVASVPLKGPAGSALRGSESWVSWVKELQDFDRSDWPDLADKALVAYARSIGFKPEAPRR